MAAPPPRKFATATLNLEGLALTYHWACCGRG
ncbi:hypothetical protein ACVWW1_007788 [Bradyrhizobium sp. JR3.5]